MRTSTLLLPFSALLAAGILSFVAARAGEVSPLPTITPATTVVTEPGLPTATFRTPTHTAHNQGPAPVIVATPAIGTSLSLGAHAISVTLTDSCDNVTTSSYTLTVVDVEKPLLTRPATIVTSTAVNSCDAAIFFPSPTASDNDSIASIVFTPPSGTVFPKGTTVVTCTATDPSGNKTSVTFSAVVNDTRPPTISCPANITIGTELNLCDAVVTYAAPTANDNCPGFTVTSTPASGARFPKGTTTVLCSVTDTSNLTTQCSFTVTVNDNQPPIFTCPGNITVFIDGPATATPVAFATPIAGDNCPGVVNVVMSRASGSSFSLGTTPVTVTATDVSGNAATCSFTVTVSLNDGVPPVITCPANITMGTTAGTCGAAVTYATPTATDDKPGIGAVTCTPASGSVFPKGTTTVNCSVSDAAGNSSSCSFTVTVNDVQAPALTCPANMTRGTDAGSCGAVVTFATPTATDACPGAVSVTSSPASGSTFPKGTTTVNVSAADASGNTSTCSFTVTVNDTQAPAITCPANITQANDAGAAGAVVTFATPTASDACPGVVTVATSRASGSTFAIGTTTVTGTATDAAGNSATCTFTVTVNDAQAPTITCPANITKATDAGSCGAVVIYTAPTATDNAPGLGQVTCTPASGATFPKGTTTVNCSVTDAAGNTSSCSFTVTVNDTQAPSFTCPANITKSNDSGSCGAVVTFVTPTATDNCPGVGIVTSNLASGSTFAKGTTTVNLSATDASGNVGSCSFTVTVSDTQAPAITCPANITKATDAGSCGAVVTFALPTASDNCSSLGAVTCTPAPGSAFPKGTTTVNGSVTDASGNTSSCSFTVTVNDGEAPSITCPSNITTATDPGSAGAVVTFATPAASDNCPGIGSVTCNPASGATFAKGTTTVNCSVSDASGNSSSCAFTVTVNDTEAPSLTIPSSVTVTTDAGQCGAAVTFTAPTATDNSPGVGAVSLTAASGSSFPKGTTTVQASVSDASGNTTAKSFTITVNDAETPVLGATPGVTASTEPGQCGASVAFAAPTVTDNCPGAGAAVATIPSGTFFPLGATTVTFSATDASGNTTRRSFTVTVVDSEVPVLLTIPDFVVFAGGSPCTGAAVHYPTPTASDNCALTTPTFAPPEGTFLAPGVTTVTCTVSDLAGNVTSTTFHVAVACPSDVKKFKKSGFFECSFTGAPEEPADAAGALLPTLLTLGWLAIRRRGARAG